MSDPVGMLQDSGEVMREIGRRNRNFKPEPLPNWLLREKRRSGLSFSELATRTFVSKSALHRATQGSGLPRREIFEAFVNVCGSDPEEAEEQWQWAEMLQNLPMNLIPSFRMRPEAVMTHGELRQALAQLIEKNGESLRQLESRAQARGGRLRRSTLSDALRGRFRFGRGVVAELVRACGEAEGAVTAWDEAWQRAERERRSRTGHMGAVRRLPSEARELIELGVAEMFRLGGQHGIPDAEIEFYIRQRAASERRWPFRSYWMNPPESWKRATQGSLAQVPRRLDEALRSILAEERDRPLNEEVMSRVAQEVMKVLADIAPRVETEPVESEIVEEGGTA
ncbi:helix-turn-helix transcriptional regulator [Streptomyces sp. C1-2]|uniref:helix-turn-helix domain-containing protein n=1 Tax=Streptomyces sp. C1-2 TaxID=2720022 RepID=UPI0014325862|nr:helix-turn-helix transcriptional regulator [Streptomyces sp. C1-2]NJP74081.1 helix-turn-helix domain-containing protein [Streptomyces sp. C1-2]